MGFVKANPWRIISFEFMGLLLLVLALSLAPLPRLHAKTDTKKCWYILEVRTSNWPHRKAGTDNPVRVRFMDKNGSNVTIHPLKDPFEVNHGKKSEPFKRRATAKFNITGPCLEGEVCSLQFQVQGDDSWRVDYAQVHGESVPRFRCSYHRTVPANAWSAYDRCNPQVQLASTPQEFIACNNDENENENEN